MDNYLSFANSGLMWLVIAPGIVITVIQAIFFLRKGLNIGKEIGITGEQWKRVVSAAAATAIGPALVAAASCLALIVVIGAPMSVLRLGFIGSAQFELASAGAAATAAGASLSASDMNMSIFSTVVWTMSIISSGWVIVSVLFIHKMDTLQKIVAKGNNVRMFIFSTAACLGAYGYLATSQCLESESIPTAFVACISAALIQAIFLIVSKQKKIKWMTTWGFTISMFAGLIIAAVAFPPAV